MAMSVEEERVVASVPMGLLIGGEWRHARSGNELRVEDPATGDSIAMVADGGPEDAIDALEAASRAQASWAATAPRFRAEILRAAFELIMARQDDLALL